ncbi:MAG: insulinase family protein [Fimbriimonadaceae bacterium]|nr:insulinase family protein [Chitinophagales bacterium]
MIHYKKFILDNGLTVIINEDFTTQLVAVDVLYKVGARDEEITRTGFAHLFEHLMFGGSKNIPEFDTPLQLASGTNNAFTTNDLTNYYDVLPVENIETALWLESDRMLKLDFSERSLNVQRNVVCEEFKEHYINKPYGDLWHKLRKVVYKNHPYQWPTIGLELKHIQEAQLSDVENFFYKYYRPNNAILSISGAIKTDEVLGLVNKWFGEIEKGNDVIKKIPEEPLQTSARFDEVKANVPVDLIYKVWHMPGRVDSDYYAANILGDILGNGDSSRLFQKLKKEKKLFTDIGAYNAGSIDTGMFIISGKLSDDVKYEDAEKGISEEVEKIISEKVNEKELIRVKNMIEMDIAESYTGILNKAQGLAICEMLESADIINTEIDRFLNVTLDDVLTSAQNILSNEKSSTLYYRKN